MFHGSLRLLNVTVGQILEVGQVKKWRDFLWQNILRLI